MITTYYIPTKEWMDSRNPSTKKGIIEWYKRELRVLDATLHGPVKRKFIATVVNVDSHTKEIISKSAKPKVFEIERWKISQKDFYVYKRLLDERFQGYKRAHNERIRNERTKQKTSGS